MSKKKKGTGKQKSFKKGHGTHTYTDEELESTKNFINSRLAKDKTVNYILPIDDPEELFDKVKDGVLLSKLINIAVPNTIDERVINLPKKKKT